MHFHILIPWNKERLQDRTDYPHSCAWHVSPNERRATRQRAVLHIDFGLFLLHTIRGWGSAGVMHEFLLNKSEQNLDNTELNVCNWARFKATHCLSSFFFPSRPVRKFPLVGSVCERVTKVSSWGWSVLLNFVTASFDLRLCAFMWRLSCSSIMVVFTKKRIRSLSLAVSLHGSDSWHFVTDAHGL